MSRLPIFILFWIVFLLIDLYVFRGLRISYPLADKPILRIGSYILYWSATAFLSFCLIRFLAQAGQVRPSTSWVLAFSGVFIAMYLPKAIILIFNLLSDIRCAVEWALLKFNFSEKSTAESSIQITRNDFLRIAGSLLALIPFGSVLYGIFYGRFNFRLEEIEVSSHKLRPNSPPIRVVQISDAHLGSFLENKAPVEDAIQRINDLKPDLILFTGDLVNDRADEAEPWIDVFSQLQAKHGKYSVLGNHDYGDYVQWPSKEAKTENLERLKQIHAKMGFRLLLNENERLEINENSIEISGVENWGLPPFPQHGNLDLAQEKVDPNAFNILLSHDPTHFDEQVVKHSKKPDLTLSGHTH
ncbi:MAG: metallophosphoesterase, partial [Luteibaculum sp.]